MDKYLKQTPDFDIELDLSQNSLFVISNIQFSWLNEAFTSVWTEIEKNKLSNQINRQIWNNWNNLIQLKKAEKSSLFSKKKNGNEIPIVFIGQASNSNPHWTVQMNKVPKGSSSQYTIHWSIRRINIDVEDSSNQQFGNRNNSFGQSDSSDDGGYWSQHKEEFANANSISNYSIGNVGTQLREKYFELIPELINDKQEPLVPKTVFAIENLN